MHQLCYKVASEEASVIKATGLRTLVKYEFVRSEQHDANEFILHIFDKLQDEQTPKFAKFISDKYKNSIDAWNGYASEHKSIIDQLFTGMSQNNIE